MKYTSKEKLPCVKCGHNRWKTKYKKNPSKQTSVYSCRKCGNEREVTAFQYYNQETDYILEWQGK